jgi:hypothetical protein
MQSGLTVQPAALSHFDGKRCGLYAIGPDKLGVGRYSIWHWSVRSLSCRSFFLSGLAGLKGPISTSGLLLFLLSLILTVEQLTRTIQAAPF